MRKVINLESFLIPLALGFLFSACSIQNSQFHAIKKSTSVPVTESNVGQPFTELGCNVLVGAGYIE